MEVRDVLGDYTSSTDSTSPSNSDSSKHNDATTEPTILTDIDITTAFGTFDTVAEERVDWMSCGEEGTAGSDQCPGTDIDIAGV